MKILVVNAGSSSLKYQLFDMDKSTVMAKGLCERIGIEGSRLKHKWDDQEVVIEEVMNDHSDAVRLVLEALTSAEHGVIKDMNEIGAVGHRVVHGGEKFAESVVIDDEVKKAIKDCYELAPLHNPPNMTGIEACEKAMPGVPQVAVFDTAFHQTMPKEAYMYALPYEVYERHGIRRYGFHGTSHMFVSQRALEILDNKDAKIVTCHLGNGSSLAAVDGGKCIDTSMGMTPLAGICMGTRCGDIDPAVVTFLMDKEGLSTKEIDNLMNKESGVDGISGVSSDFRDLEAAEEDGNERAELALDMFTYQCKKLIGSYAAAMGGLDAIVFTAGIGENDDGVREDATAGLEFLGVKLDKALNEKIHGKEQIISAEDSKVKVIVIPTNEELAIARDTMRLAGK